MRVHYFRCRQGITAASEHTSGNISLRRLGCKSKDQVAKIIQAFFEKLQVFWKDGVMSHTPNYKYPLAISLLVQDGGTQ